MNKPSRDGGQSTLPDLIDLIKYWFKPNGLNLFISTNPHKHFKTKTLSFRHNLLVL